MRERSAIGRVILVAAPLAWMCTACAGCAAAAEDWRAAARTWTRGADDYRGFDRDGDGRLEYVQRLRDGYADRLWFAARRDGRDWMASVRRPAADPQEEPLLVLLLDGVSYERIAALKAAGRFALFQPPAPVVSVFPTLTDVAYDHFFQTGPTPGYEAGYFDRSANRLSDAAGVYLHGANERWVRCADHRLAFIEDAFMYLMPRRVFHAELRRARRRVETLLAAGRRSLVIYLLSTDALGHMLAPQEIERELTKLDDWIERLMYDCRGRLEVVMLADHGNTTVPPRRFKLRELLRDAGLRVVSRLERSGDVAVPLFGLLDVARVHTFDAATRDRVLELLEPRAEVALLACRDGDAICVRAAGQTAMVESRGGRYRCVGQGDPLQLATVAVRMRAAGSMDAEGFASADAWLEATAEHPWPAGPPRLFEGMRTLSDEQPDVAVSLAEGWFVGSGFLSSFVNMRGTHGGLGRGASETFVMTTSRRYDPPLTLEQVAELIARDFGWRGDGECQKSEVRSQKRKRVRCRAGRLTSVVVSGGTGILPVPGCTRTGETPVPPKCSGSFPQPRGALLSPRPGVRREEAMRCRACGYWMSVSATRTTPPSERCWLRTSMSRSTASCTCMRRWQRFRGGHTPWSW
ncbi:Type I phosphodiesterase / nucleotide pyrophosphatase [Phycisphaerae bacterium RAS1]|nr:Type I phosphodiesterase / nucleotide pyrophosphatase [Phycisphaerae bacterium RAS1]